VRALTKDDFPSFIAAREAAVIHFDAVWDDINRRVTRKLMLEAEQSLAGWVNFAEVDTDTEPDLAKSIPVCNVPLVAYYRDGKLIAALVGRGQNVLARVERMLRGERIGHDDGTYMPNDCNHL
jgi:thioredoxin-like negative regulator of GroEL